MLGITPVAIEVAIHASKSAALYSPAESSRGANEVCVGAENAEDGNADGRKHQHKEEFVPMKSSDDLQSRPSDEGCGAAVDPQHNTRMLRYWWLLPSVGGSGTKTFVNYSVQCKLEERTKYRRRRFDAPGVTSGDNHGAAAPGGGRN